MAKPRSSGVAFVQNVVTLAVTSNACTPDGDGSNVNHVSHTANLTVNAPSGSPQDGQKLELRIKNTGASDITLIMNPIYRYNTDLTGVSNVVVGKINRLQFEYYSADSKWDLISEIRGS